ncbi:phosphopantetheine-binding protein [soil metagenome]
MRREDIEGVIARREAVLSRIRKVLIEQIGVRREPEEIDPDAPLFGTGLALDSIDAVELVVSLETAFAVRFPDGYMDRRTMRTVGTLVDAVLSLDANSEAAHG